MTLIMNWHINTISLRPAFCHCLKVSYIYISEFYKRCIFLFIKSRT